MVIRPTEGFVTCKGSMPPRRPAPFGHCDRCGAMRILTIVYNDAGDEVNCHCDECLW